MNKAESAYFSLLTVLARIVGGWFVLGGLVFVAWGTVLLTDKTSTFSINGVPSHDPIDKAVPLVLGLVVSGLGILLLFARGFKTKDK
jgi:hypothetical protein